MFATVVLQSTSPTASEASDDSVVQLDDRLFSIPVRRNPDVPIGLPGALRGPARSTRAPGLILLAYQECGDRQAKLMAVRFPKIKKSRQL